MNHVFGAYAADWAKHHTLADSSAIVCDPTGFPGAIAALISRRERGLRADALVILPHPRLVLLQSIYGSLLPAGTTRDAAQQMLQAFAAGALALDNRPQAVAERSIYTNASAAYRDLAIVADNVCYRSQTERALAAEIFSFAPPRTRILSSSLVVPQGSGTAEPSIAVYGAGMPVELAKAVGLALEDFRTPVRILHESVSSTDTWAALLQHARVIVALDDDPSTASDLAQYGKPVCAASPSAFERLSGVNVFDAFDPLSVADAVQRALGSPAPRALAAASGEPAARPDEEKDYPLVSVIMTVWDRVAHLRENLRSLQNQTYPNVEYIVVSNAGPRCDEMLREFPNVRYIHRETNSGTPVAPRNDGIAAARGKYVTFLDDDDAFFPDHIATMVDALSHGARAAYSDFLIRIVQPSDDGKDTILGWDLEKPFGITQDDLLVVNRLGYMTVFAERALFDETGVYDDTVTAGEENELWLRMMHATDFVHVARASAVYTIRSAWQGQFTAERHSAFATGYEIIYSRYPSPELPTIAAQRQAHLHALRSTDAPPPRPARYPAVKV